MYSVWLTFIIAWRGLAALLILEVRQCESLKSGIGRSRNPHAFFISRFKRLNSKQIEGKCKFVNTNKQEIDLNF